MEIQFVRLNESHLEQVMHWRQLPEITKFMYTDPVLTLPQQQQWFASLNEEQARYWVMQVEEQPIGLLAVYHIDWQHQKCEWAYYIGESSFQGKGLARQIEYNVYAYVFDTLKLNKLSCEVFCENQKVVALHEKCGMQIEGTLKAHICKNDRFYNVVVMAILRADWDGVKAAIAPELVLGKIK